MPKPLFRVERLSHPGQVFPLIRFFWFTNEPLNPWRCESCLTAKQRRLVPTSETRFAVDWTIVVPNERSEKPECCRKCGVDFM
jgi:hypothetical protein